MATTERPMVIGVFRDRALVGHAVKALQHARFRDDEIRVWGQGISQGGFLESLLTKWSGQATDPGRDRRLPGKSGSDERGSRLLPA
jgi:hypothetical protein